MIADLSLRDVCIHVLIRAPIIVVYNFVVALINNVTLCLLKNHNPQYLPQCRCLCSVSPPDSTEKAVPIEYA